MINQIFNAFVNEFTAGMVLGVASTWLFNKLDSFFSLRRTKKTLIKELEFNKSSIKDWLELLENTEKNWDSGSRIHSSIHTIDRAFDASLNNSVAFQIFTTKEVSAISHFYTTLKKVRDKFNKEEVGRKMNKSEFSEVRERYSKTINTLFRLFKENPITC